MINAGSMDRRQIGNSSICDNTQWPKKSPIGTKTTINNCFVTRVDREGQLLCSLQPLTSPLYEDPPNYCTAFRQWREDRRIGLRHAAKLLGIPASVISKMERGEIIVTEEDFAQFKKTIIASLTPKHMRP
jgi:hypothetical protein